MKYIYLVVLAFMLTSCSLAELSVSENDCQKKTKVKKVSQKKTDTVKTKSKDIPKVVISKTTQRENKKVDIFNDIPQNVSYFANELTSDVKIYDIQKNYEKNYFNVWNDFKPRESLKEIKWPFSTFKPNNSYGENLQPLKQKFFDEMLENSNFNDYATLNKKAISLSESNIRAFPTSKPLLKNPKKAGEGFPFDYLQNSSLHANKPLFASHYSKDKAWIYVFSSFTSGWVKSNQIAFLKQEYVDAWQKAQQIFLIKEGVPLYNENGNFLFYSKIGMMLALISEDEKNFTALAISSTVNNKSIYEKVKIAKTIAQKNILKLDKESLISIIEEVSKSNYGWGGLYGQRDCSSMLRDIYAPFGIWLPRNSSKQSKVGKVISLKNLNNQQKIALIKQLAIPFETFLYKNGHIALYVGTFKNQIIIFHSTWGIKTKKNDESNRFVVGKAVFSTLEFGNNLEYYDEKSSMLKTLESMNIITQ